MGTIRSLSRRRLLAAAGATTTRAATDASVAAVTSTVATATAILAAPTVIGGCARRAPIAGGFVGASHERGHRLRNDLPAASGGPRRVTVAIVGAGIAGLAAARALAAAGVDDYRLFELEDAGGGNSRGGELAGFACPWGAHYLPTPGATAGEVRDLLAELGLVRRVEGIDRYDERALCHAPQERLFIDGRWHDGLLPVDSQPASTIDQYRRFSDRIAAFQALRGFAVPVARARPSIDIDRLDKVTFAQWLDAEGFDSPALNWYLDYCCRDDYGAGYGQVSAWAGIHYFASRHGFSAPGSAERGSDGVLTWPQGNGWLVERMQAPHRDRIELRSIGVRATDTGRGATLDVMDADSGHVVRWQADWLILAVPLFVAARLLDRPPPALAAAAAGLDHASWVVANLHLPTMPRERPGAPRAWDNVFYGSNSLGYVDATHQSLHPYRGATVLTWYWAGGVLDAAQRRGWFAIGWRSWVDRILTDLAPAHPDLERHVARIDIMRWGHAMAVPRPGVHTHPALRELARSAGRIRFAHADLSGHSVFEEAFTHGHRVGGEVARAVSGLSTSGLSPSGRAASATRRAPR